MIAQLSVHPIREGTSLGRFVRKGVAVIKESDYQYVGAGLVPALSVSCVYVPLIRAGTRPDQGRHKTCPYDAGPNKQPRRRQGLCRC